MAEASRGSRVYRFQVLLPSGVSVNLTLHDRDKEVLVHDLLLSVKKELSNDPVGGGREREVDWDGDIYLTDLVDKKIMDKIKLSNFDSRNINILRLHVSP